ncbi:MAG: DUF4142 domain-containing protein, partial [Caulobacteraceae bacterium]|nr:DUF4142 domain-containing protein [Caulobacteraceae bacterium]
MAVRVLAAAATALTLAACGQGAAPPAENSPAAPHDEAA